MLSEAQLGHTMSTLLTMWQQLKSLTFVSRGASGEPAGFRPAESEVMTQGVTLSDGADKDTLFSLTVQNHITAHTVSHTWER